MNGVIEDNNCEFGDKLWERGQFKDLEHIRWEAKIFLERHNNRQDWKYRKTNREAIMDLQERSIDATARRAGHYRSAEFRKIFRSIRPTCRSQMVKCTSYGR